MYKISRSSVSEHLAKAIASSRFNRSHQNTKKALKTERSEEDLLVVNYSPLTLVAQGPFLPDPTSKLTFWPSSSDA